MKIISNQCPRFVKYVTDQYRSETLSLHNHDSVKDLPNFSHVEKVSQKDPEFTNQLLYD